MVGSSLDDLDKTRLERTSSALSRLVPTRRLGFHARGSQARRDLGYGCHADALGYPALCEQPEQYIYGAYIDLAVYNHDIPDGNTVDSRQITGPLPSKCRISKPLL